MQYVINGKANNVSFPEFTVEAADAAEARKLANRIVDPLRRIYTEITAIEMPRAAWRYALECQLTEAVGTLKSTAPLDWHHALYALAKKVAQYTGEDWDALTADVTA